MSKYDGLWAWIGQQPGEKLTLSFAQIGEKGGVPIDHSFLTCKKELAAWGWQVMKISMKQQTVTFERIRTEKE